MYFRVPRTSYDVWYLCDDTNDPVGGEEVKTSLCWYQGLRREGSYMPPRNYLHRTSFFPHALRCPRHTPHPNLPRPTYPKEVLKHRFVPFDSLYGEDVEQMEIDEDSSLPKGSKPTADTLSESGGKLKERKVETTEDSSEPRKLRKSRGTSS
ncbi:hypothetical protein QCA50_007536 [Cerrena zonata]|uniref:Uncharacterized protein n=1 Tax=Cerrena zonata TaxID=2478898 RepID=A0AAW0GBA2_9APHY